LVHLDVKKLGKITDGGGWRPLGCAATVAERRLPLYRWRGRRVPAIRMPSGGPEPDSAMYCPPAAVLSGVPMADLGQVKVTPDEVIWSLGAAPAAAMACA
jgi:hypothetical protein